MSEVETLTGWVRSLLGRWGDEYALHRDAEHLGFPSKNILQVCMEHKGPPSRAQGYKPTEIDADAQLVEDFVRKLHATNPDCAYVLRGYYCGRGRRAHERFDTANELLARAGRRKVSKRQYFYLRQDGESALLRHLLGMMRSP